jgi:hypothetical protein
MGEIMSKLALGSKQIAVAFVPKQCKDSDPFPYPEAEAFLTIFKECVRKEADFAKIPLDEAFVVLTEEKLSEYNIGRIVYIYPNQGGSGCSGEHTFPLAAGAFNVELSQGAGSQAFESDCIITYHYGQGVTKGRETNRFINKLTAALRDPSFGLKKYERQFSAIDMQFLGLFTSILGIAIMAVAFTAFNAVALPGVVAGAVLTATGLGLFVNNWRCSQEDSTSREANLAMV